MAALDWSSVRPTIYVGVCGHIGYAPSKERPARRIDAVALIIEYDEAH